MRQLYAECAYEPAMRETLRRAATLHGEKRTARSIGREALWTSAA
ncbi:MAG: hypothetical protein ACLTG0_15175 [Oscillibacter sp.]